MTTYKDIFLATWNYWEMRMLVLTSPALHQVSLLFSAVLSLLL
jgi:hypothetical protein